MTRKRWLVTGFAILTLVGMYVPQFFVHEEPYGDVPIPGSATLHLPPGEMDLTLRSVGSLEGQPVPPLSIRISGPAGLPQPEVTESRRTKYFTAEDLWVRVWVVDVAQEADYQIKIDGEVYGPYQPWLTFRHMGNDFVGVLVLMAAMLSSFVISVAIMVGVVVLAAMLFGRCAAGIGKLDRRRPEPPS